MAINQISSSNTFAQWLVATQALIEKQNYVEKYFNLTTGTLTANTAAFIGNTSVKLPSGKTDERTSGDPGEIRYNTDLDTFEGYSTFWGPIGGGATGGAGNAIFWENEQIVTQNYTITANRNAGTFGPVIIADGIEVIIPDGSQWTIV